MLKIQKCFQNYFHVKVLTISIMCIFLMFTLFTYNSIEIGNEQIEGELIRNGHTLIRLLAYNSRIGLFSENKVLLENAAQSIMQEKDVISVDVFDKTGKLLQTNKKQRNGYIHHNSANSEQITIDKNIINEINPIVVKKEDGFIELLAPIYNINIFAIDDKLTPSASVDADKKTLLGFARITISTSALQIGKKELMHKNLILFIIFILLAIIVIYFSIKQITEPLTTLREQLRVFAEKGTVNKLPIKTSDEIGKVSQAFNDMVNTLHKKEEERQKLEKHMMKIQKYEAIGLLSGGIAHDINNILTAFIGKISLARLYILKDAYVAIERLNEALAVIQDAKELSKHLLTLSKEGMALKKAPTDMNSLLKTTTDFILGGSTVQYTISTPDNMWMCNIDANYINQVINNILLNAKVAIGENGIVIINAENFIINDNNTIPLSPGKYLKISIKDNGIGMDEECLNNLFTPFFTTKKEGTGLGLATSYSIVQKHDGHLSAESKPGEGTTFYIYLPALQPLPNDQPKVKQHTQNTKITPKILFMDDDDDIRDSIGELMKSHGYDITTTSEGNETIQLYNEALRLNNPFDIVILDLTIQNGMNGIDTIKYLNKIDPLVQIIIASGYTKNIINDNNCPIIYKAIVQKPYSVEDIINAINSIDD
ncbi:MAG: ATP-binding protein [Candidatus Magnetoovum sp. WYHC-5]|nr:ATP-binding protein [Candidatus Magnetoovum sp. WYHC-5]